MNQKLIDDLAIEHGLACDGVPDSWDTEAINNYTRAVIMECVGRCDVIASEASAAKNSNFTTDMGKQLFSGMWGGAMGCGNAIMMHFGIEVPEERM